VAEAQKLYQEKYDELPDMEDFWDLLFLARRVAHGTAGS
jgi:hypothetical protein